MPPKFIILNLGKIPKMPLFPPKRRNAGKSRRKKLNLDGKKIKV
jgi:hypothetical protein